MLIGKPAYMSDALLYQVALSMVPHVGAVTARVLVQHCGSAEAVFRLRRQVLLKIPGIGSVIADHLKDATLLIRAEAELDFMAREGIEAVFFTDAHYPFRLRQCHDAPALLFFKASDFSLLDADRVVGVVGTRQPTEYGKGICEELVEGLSQYNVTVVSGLAYGVDILTHRKCVGLGVPNFGVLGHGLRTLYPGAHRSTALRMMERGGLVTEYVSGIPPDREHFPMRNRIIAGLSDALLVVETGVRGGSMITAELSRQYSRDIFAIPGRAKDVRSAGCNNLIKQNIAQLTETADEMAMSLRWDDPYGKSFGVQTQLLLDLKEEERLVYEIIRERPEVFIDVLIRVSGIGQAQLVGLLLNLELRGIIRMLPGKRYIVQI
jgi:DNA processing protein